MFGGTLEIEIAGIADFDRAIVTDLLDVTSGTFAFTFLDGYAPIAGDTFEFITTGEGVLDFTGFAITLAGLDQPVNHAVYVQGNSVNPGILAQVPEPGTAVLLAIAIAGIGAARRRRG